MEKTKAKIVYNYGFLTPPPELFQSSDSQKRLSGNIKAQTDRPLLLAKVMERLEYPKEGGVQAYFKGYTHPAKGFPYPDIVYKLNAVKKTLLALIKLATTFPAIIFLSPLILSKRFIRKFLEIVVIDYMYGYLEPIFMREQYLCKTARETRQAMIKAMQNTIRPKDWKKAEQVIEVAIHILEFDNAYRYRYQDIIMELNKGSFAKDQTKEITRLLKLMGDREIRTDVETFEEVQQTTMVDKYNNIGKLLRILLFLKPSLKKMLKDFVKYVDLEKAGLDIDDTYWCLFRYDYNFQGSSFKERWILKEKLHEKNQRLDDYIKEMATT